MGVSPPPLLTVLGVEAVILGVLAALFAALWWRGRDPGMPWVVAGFAFAAAWYQNSGNLPSTGPNINSQAERAWAIVIAAAVLCVSTGVVQYLGLPKGRSRWLVWVCGLPGLVLIAMLAVAGDVPHRVFHVGVLFAYVGGAALAFRRAATEPGDGHAVLGLALLSLPATPFLLVFTGVAASELQYFAGMSLAVFGMVLLTVCLLRRHRALAVEVQRRTEAEALLREANARLEARVHERTAHLRELIGGLEAFNRGVSHDLRGPLGGMSSLAHMAADAMARGDASLAQRALPMIARQCDASVQMVGTMLDLARIGDTPVRHEPVCLSDIARAAFDEVMLSVPEGARPALLCHSLPMVQADPNLLRAVFVNLIGNAVKFTRGSAAPQIDVDAAADGHDVSVCVRDNGIGFAPELAQRIFEPFYRGHAASHEGHGLGLSIVRRAVNAMGGTAWAQAAEGSGASLCFRIPDALDLVSEQRSAEVESIT